MREQLHLQSNSDFIWMLTLWRDWAWGANRACGHKYSATEQNSLCCQWEIGQISFKDSWKQLLPQLKPFYTPSFTTVPPTTPHSPTPISSFHATLSRCWWRLVDIHAQRSNFTHLLSRLWLCDYKVLFVFFFSGSGQSELEYELRLMLLHHCQKGINRCTGGSFTEGADITSHSLQMLSPVGAEGAAWKAFPLASCSGWTRPKNV